MENLLPYFKALCDENRVRIVGILLEREHCVCELIDRLDLSQSTVSHHVRILKDAGLISDRRQGKWNYYSLDKEGFARYAALLDRDLFSPVSNTAWRECPALAGHAPGANRPQAEGCRKVPEDRPDLPCRGG